MHYSQLDTDAWPEKIKGCLQAADESNTYTKQQAACGAQGKRTSSKAAAKQAMHK